jgi:hypothetical protein
MKGSLLKIGMLAAITLVLGPRSVESADAATFNVNFDTLPDGSSVTSGTRISNQYSPFGVTFSLYENSALVGTPLASSDFIGGAGSGNGLFNVVGDISPQNNSNRADELVIEFSQAASNVSFTTNGFGDPTAFDFIAFNPSGTLLQTITNTTGNLSNISFNGGLISRIVARQGLDDFTYRIDNLSYTLAEQVPTPVLIPSLIGMGIGVLRKRKSESQVRIVEEV